LRSNSLEQFSDRSLGLYGSPKKIEVCSVVAGLDPRSEGSSNQHHSNWGQSLASNATSVGEDGAPAFCGHAIAEAMLALAPNFRRLVLAFHAILNGTFDVLGARKRTLELPRCLQRRGENINEGGGVKQADGQFLNP
jgi:hypothetical protein